MPEDTEPRLLKIMMTPVGPASAIGDLQDWADGMIGIAKGLLEKDGYAAPMLMFLAPDQRDPTMVVQGVLPLLDFLSGAPEDAQEKKELMAQVLPQVLSETRAFASLLITEAWMGKQPDADSPEEVMQRFREAGSVKDMEGSIEVLSTLFETKQKSSMRAWKIERDDEGNPSAGEEVGDGEDFGEAEGRFATLLHAKPGGGSN